MFEIIVKIMDLVLKGFASSQSYKKDNKYKELYLLYLAINAVIAKSVTANEHYLPVDWDSHFLVNTSSFDGPIEKWVFFTNNDFSELSKSVEEFLRQLNKCKAAISIHDPELNSQLQLCFRGKASWMREFIETFDAGTLSPDGKKLITKSLTIAESIEDEVNDQEPWKEYKAQLIVNEFDTSDKKKRLAIVEKGRANIKPMKEVAEQLRVFIKDNVSVEQLL